MLSLFRKKSEEAAAVVMPAWHPNFRDYQKLPDVKVVRTAFFVNGGAVFVALGLAVYVASQEVHLHTLGAQIAEEQAKIDRAKKGSEQALAAFKKFQAEEAVTLEVDAFVKSKPAVSARRAAEAKRSGRTFGRSRTWGRCVSVTRSRMISGGSRRSTLSPAPMVSRPLASFAPVTFTWSASWKRRTKARAAMP